MQKNTFFILLLLLFCSNGAYAQIHLIPQPKQIALSQGFFTLDVNTSIQTNGLDTFYKKQINNCVNNEWHFSLDKTAKPVNTITFVVLPNAKTLSTYVSNKTWKITENKESYLLDINEQAIHIYALDTVGIFYGIQTLKQLILAAPKPQKLPCLQLYDYPDMAIRAWQDDVSRGPIPTMAMLKQQIREMSAFKLNYFTLYIEHVFQLEKHPGIAPADGFTKIEIEHLTQYAKQYHVKLIGNYQSFGHMEETLKHPDYAHLGDNEHIISPALEASYEFLDDVYREIVPVFDGQYFNINCDETFGLGEGKSKAMVDSLGIEGVYLYHINRLNGLLKQYDKKILMWGDIVTSYPHIIKALPQDITVMAWAYHKADNFDNVILPIQKTGLNFWVAPGINCWGNIFPDMETTKVNVYNFIRDGYKYGATGILNTSWDDDGMNFFQNNWHGLVWGAENSWNTPEVFADTKQSNAVRETRYKTFNTAFNRLFYGLLSDTLINDMLWFSNLHNHRVRTVLKNSRFFEPIFPMHAEYVSQDKKTQNQILLLEVQNFRDRLESLKPKVKRHVNTLAYLDFAAQQMAFILKKNLLRIDLHEYIEKTSDINVAALKQKIAALSHEVSHLKHEYQRLWLAENRASWLEVNMQKYDQLKADIDHLEGHCIIQADDSLSEQGRGIFIQSLFSDLLVSYSLNNAPLQACKDKFYVIEDVLIQAQAKKGDTTFPMTQQSLIYHKAIGKLLALRATWSTYHPSYNGGGKQALLDGQEGEATDLRSGKWQGFSGQNIVVEIDLEHEQDLHSFAMGCFQNTHDWVIFPPQIDIYYRSDTTKTYQKHSSIATQIPPQAKGNLKQVYKADLKGLTTRYIKIVAHNYGKLPEWHHAGSAYDAMLFADEIVIK